MLSASIWLPILGAAIVGLIPGINAKGLRSIALAIATSTLLWLGYLGTQFDFNTPGLQFQEFLSWIETLGLNYQLGVDGLSFPLLALNALLTWIAIYSSNTALRPRLYYSLILLVSAGMAGAFAAQNLLLFFLFYELELIPL